MRLAHGMIAAPLVVTLAACGGVAGGSVTAQRPAPAASVATPPPVPSPSTGPAGSSPSTGSAGSGSASDGDAPATDARIPADPAQLAAALHRTTTELNSEIDAWRASAAEQPPRRVVLLALHHQRIYRAMARDATLAQRTIRKLPAATAAHARDNVTAVGRLLAMARPISDAQRKRMRFAEPLPAERLHGYMTRAEKRFGVEWEVLAAIMLVETKFGRVRSASSSGAQGPMQFMPGTWRAYGLGGDVHDARDAILAAANYLKASGAPRDYRRAVFAYNHDTRYVDSVLAHARSIRRDARAYYAYHNWQVFTLSAKGDVRMTGPR
ncbi:lytic transglycosylase domain-containing protein [Nonomuraea indica]|uniref:lytic transglycosylase domain-containing protein n=1 Tax=Nonomuraea indica TaxID=1581193 RepID=UPI000C7E4E00|nr:lytic transglycosylase domain-containing protein [Nonomuraea indica]